MVSQILVIGANAPYDFEDPQTKRKVSGRTVHYVIRDLPDQAPAAGYTPSSQAITLEAAKRIQEVPGIYKGHFQLRNNKGKPELRLVEVEFVSPVKL